MFDVGSALDVVKHARATITDAKSVINDAARRATDRKMSSQTIGPLADSILTLPGVILFGWLCTERHWKTDGGGVNAIESSARKICQVALSQIRGCLDDGEHREPGIKWREVKTFYFHGNPRLSFRDRAPTLIDLEPDVPLQWPSFRSRSDGRPLDYITRNARGSPLYSAPGRRRSQSFRLSRDVFQRGSSAV